MDSKYAAINGRSNGATPSPNKLNLKRKWSSPNLPNASGQAFKKQCGNSPAANGHAARNGQSPNGGGGHQQPRAPQLSIMDQRRALPVFQVRQKLMQKIRANSTLIVIGETGSGKTTQIPQFLFDEGYAATEGSQIAVTQPRRVAAITLATRVSQESGVRLGERVGYTVRFEDMSSAAQTKIKYVTDGTLLREALSDRQLRRYSVIVLDEAHERTINTDVLFGLIKAAQKTRAERPKTTGGCGPLKVIVMSATMDVDHFAKYWNGCECVYLAGRAHPVQVLHAKDTQTEYTQACVSTLFDIHRSAPAGHDILIFLTGQEEIEHTASQIRTIARSPEYQQAGNSGAASLPRLFVHTLYSQQSQQKQLEVFRASAPNTRKVVLCTNIAETSLTIHGIRYVIDSGRVKRATYNSASGLETLRVERIAQDQAWQRTGRAGRQAAGHCYRTYTMAEYRAMPAATMPEILRANIVTTVLQLAAIGIDCARFDFIDPPDAAAVADAQRQLQALGALEAGADMVQLTPIGRQMARFPLDPRFSRMLLAASAGRCLAQMLSIVAVLAGESVFVEPVAGEPEQRAKAQAAHAKFDAPNGDHQTMLNVFRAFEENAAAKVWCSQNWLSWRNLAYARDVRAQLLKICEQLGLAVDADEEGAEEEEEENADADEQDAIDNGAAKKRREALSEEAEDDAVRKCLLAGLFGSVAELTSDGHTYKTRTASRQKVKLHPSSRAMRAGRRPQCVVYTELIVTGQSYMRNVTAVEADWLPEKGAPAATVAAPTFQLLRHR